MAKDVFWTTITLSIIIAVLGLAFWSSNKGQVVTYDCRMAEISLDFPVEVKEACRKRSINK